MTGELLEEVDAILQVKKSHNSHLTYIGNTNSFQTIIDKNLFYYYNVITLIIFP